MSKPIVIAHHLTWTAYGFWLPNDPRGSMSTAIASDIIAELGALHYGRKQIQPSGRVVREFHKQAEQILKHPVLAFNAKDVDAIAAAMSEVVNQEKYTCYACAIMPDHIHILIRKHRKQAEEMIEDFQSACRLRLSNSGQRRPTTRSLRAAAGQSFSIIPMRFAEP